MTSSIDRLLAPVLVVSTFSALAWFAGGAAMAIAMGVAVMLLLLVQMWAALEDETRPSHIGAAGFLNGRPARSSSGLLARGTRP